MGIKQAISESIFWSKDAKGWAAYCRWGHLSSTGKTQAEAVGNLVRDLVQVATTPIYIILTANNVVLMVQAVGGRRYGYYIIRGQSPATVTLSWDTQEEAIERARALANSNFGGIRWECWL